MSSSVFASFYIDGRLQIEGAIFAKSICNTNRPQYISYSTHSLHGAHILCKTYIVHGVCFRCLNGRSSYNICYFFFGVLLLFHHQILLLLLLFRILPIEMCRFDMVCWCIWGCFGMKTTTDRAYPCQNMYSVFTYCVIRMNCVESERLRRLYCLRALYSWVFLSVGFFFYIRFTESAFSSFSFLKSM